MQSLYILQCSSGCRVDTKDLKAKSPVKIQSKLQILQHLFTKMDPKKANTLHGFPSILCARKFQFDGELMSLIKVSIVLYLAQKTST